MRYTVPPPPLVRTVKSAFDELRKRLELNPPRVLVATDECSAIRWLKQQLSNKPLMWYDRAFTRSGEEA